MPHTSRARTIGSWVLAILLGALFVLNGIGKVQSEGWVQRFADWGYAPWFLYVTAALELVGGALLFVPRLAAYGAVIITLVMAGATYTHLASSIGTPVASFVILLLAGLLVWLRWADRWQRGMPVASPPPASG